MSELSKQLRFMADLCHCEAADERCYNCQILLRAAEQIQWLQVENQRLRDALSASVAGWNGKTEAR